MAEDKDFLEKTVELSVKKLEDLLAQTPELAGVTIVFEWKEKFAEQLPPALWMRRDGAVSPMSYGLERGAKQTLKTLQLQMELLYEQLKIIQKRTGKDEQQEGISEDDPVQGGSEES